MAEPENRYSADLETIPEEKALEPYRPYSLPRWLRLQQSPGPLRPSLIALIVIFTCLAGFLAGMLFAGKLDAQRSTAGLASVPHIRLRTEIKVFQPDPNFTSPPITNGTEPAWDSLLPNGLGYVRGEDLGPGIPVVSVFHQLHCLYTLRRAFYAEQRDEPDLQDFDFGHERTKHVGHCFEYLRQSLMCSADSTIEPGHMEGEDHKAFLGWGAPRQCQDFTQLKEWTEQRRAFDAHGFLAKDIISHHKM